MPIKQFDLAKDRLRQGGVRDAARVAEQLARGVIASAAPQTVIVVCESDRVRDFAMELGVRVHESNATTLNEAVTVAYEHLGNEFDRLLIVHSDLRSPQGLGEFVPGPGITIVTDHRRDGTNLLVVPTRLEFRFSYGRGSRLAHEIEANRLGLECAVVFDSPWAYDIDEPRDLDFDPDAR